MRSMRVEAALHVGAIMHGIMSADGSVSITVQVEGKLRGCGKGASVADAISDADRYIEAGGWYKEESGRIQRAEPNDVATIAERLDAWLPNRTRFFVVWRDGDHIAVRLNGTERVVVPEDVLTSVMNTGLMATWPSDRGYTYRTAPDPERPMAGCIMSVVRSSPNNGAGDDGFGWQYPVMQVGRARGFWEAVADALASERHEVPRVNPGK